MTDTETPEQIAARIAPCDCGTLYPPDHREDCRAYIQPAIAKALRDVARWCADKAANADDGIGVWIDIAASISERWGIK